MKVLHLISSLDARSGGTSEACAGLAEAQSDAGLEVRVLATEREGEDRRVAGRLTDHLGASGLRQVGPAVGALARHPDLAKEVEQMVADSDIVHLHGVWEEIQYLGARAAVRQGKPFVWAPHGMLDPWSLAQGKLKKRLYWWWRWQRLSRRAAALHFITRSEARLAAPMFAAGITAIVEPLGADPRVATSPETGSRGILFLSRLHPKKNVECLLDAGARISRGEWSLCIAGNGDPDYRDALNSRAGSLGIAERVSFAGDLRGGAKANAFQRSAVFCLPSHQENFGIVVIEALAAGLPVMLSPAVGLAEDLAGLPYVRIVEGGPDEWAREIAAVLDDPALRQLARTEAPALVRERFSWEAIGRNWAGHYERLKR